MTAVPACKLLPDVGVPRPRDEDLEPVAADQIGQGVARDPLGPFADSDDPAMDVQLEDNDMGMLHQVLDGVLDLRSRVLA